MQNVRISIQKEVAMSKVKKKVDPVVIVLDIVIVAMVFVIICRSKCKREQ